MTISARMSKEIKTAAPTEGAVLAALRKLPNNYLAEVLRYIEFLEYKVNAVGLDVDEDAALWAAVEANQEYKRLHPDDGLEIYETGDAFMEAVRDL
ncbi:MAG: DUF2281 domain-containing protein [Caldilineales bacterium]|nr:DUF2281 domain-containing protein [Caldilineales bacterium]MCW5857153.1 hypothetical protein [Caldilineales bacterium]